MDPAAGARERIVRTAYELFTRNGLNTVGVDRIVAEAGVAKTTLYRHFRSKEELAVAVLERHERLWLLGWLEAEASRRASAPAKQLLALFDALADWTRQPTFPGCFFLNCVLEVHDRSSKIRLAAVGSLDRIYELVLRLAREAGARDPDGLAHQLQLLMRGILVAGVEGRPDAVRAGGIAAQRLLEYETGG
jgi:AcrR family transcriptional regulator